MNKLFRFFAPLCIGLFLAASAAAQTIDVGSFSAARSRAPFATLSGLLSYGHLRASLTNTANFGPGGTICCPVVVAPGTPTITAAYLADKEVFFAGVFTGTLSAAEGAAIAAFVAGGGCVLVEANSDPNEQAAANSLLAAIGTTAFVSGSTCPNSATGGTITGASNEITDGPFGNVTSGSFGTSISTITTLDGSDVPLVACSANMRAYFPKGALGAGSGLVMYGGDPSGFDLFTDPVQSLYNANNEVLYLNAVAMCCGSTPCGQNNNKIVICHHTTSPTHPTVDLCISPSAWADHASHGDDKCPCPSAPKIPGEVAATASDFMISQNYPNPFNPSTVINYVTSIDAFVSLQVFDKNGHEVATLVEAYQPAGSYSVTFDAGSFPSGTYYYRFQSGAFSETRIMTLLK